MSTNAIPLPLNGAPIQGESLSQINDVHHGSELIETASKVDATVFSDDLSDLFGAMDNTLSTRTVTEQNIISIEHNVSNDTANVHEKLNSYEVENKVEEAEKTRAEAAATKAEAHAAEAEAASTFIQQATSTLEGVAKLSFTEGEITFKKAKDLTNKEREEALEAKDLAIVDTILKELHVAKESGLKAGDKVQVRDEHGVLHHYTVRHLTSEQVQSLLVSVKSYGSVQASKIETSEETIQKAPERKSTSKQAVQAKEEKKDIDGDKHVKKKAVETVDDSKETQRKKDDENKVEAYRSHIRQEKVIDDHFKRIEGLVQVQEARRAEHKSANYNQELGRERMIKPIGSHLVHQKPVSPNKSR